MPSRRDVDATINRLAGERCSVVHASALRAAGISRDRVARRVRDGIMVPLLPGVYAVGPQAGAPTFEMQCMAAVLSAGDSAVVCGESAAALLGIWDRSDGRVHVAGPHADRPLAPLPFIFHRVRGDGHREAPHFVGCIPVAAPAPLCLDLAATLTPLQLAFVIGRAVYRRLASIDDLVRRVDRARGRRGVRVLAEAVEPVLDGSAGTRSRSEDRLHAALVAAGIPPDLANVRGAMGVPGEEPDFVWVPERVNVEVDGGHHAEPVQAALDGERDRMARGAGWLVLRVTAREVWRDVDAVVAAIRQALELRRSRGFRNPSAFGRRIPAR